MIKKTLNLVRERENSKLKSSLKLLCTISVLTILSTNSFAMPILGSTFYGNLYNQSSIQPLSPNLTIDKSAVEDVIASVYDTNYSIDLQGDINMTDTPSGKVIKMPYTVTNADVNLEAYHKNFIIASSSTENNESDIVATFSWPAQTLAVGSGTFDANITINDSNGNGDNTFQAKKLDIDDDQAGLVAATFEYATDDQGNTGIITLKVLPGIPDKEFSNADGDHKFLYLPVTGSAGKTWLNHNLGAAYSSTDKAGDLADGCSFDLSAVSTDSTDHCAYGSLFQWGRKADGHELIHWTDSTTGEAVYDAGGTDGQTDNPQAQTFYTGNADWRATKDDTLWDGVNAADNPCPAGYRLPTGGADGDNMEWELEANEWHTDNAHDDTNASHALASPLNLTYTSNRSRSDAALYSTGTVGMYWTSNPNGNYIRKLYFKDDDTNTGSNDDRAYGITVRCIKD